VNPGSYLSNNYKTQRAGEKWEEALLFLQNVWWQQVPKHQHALALSAGRTIRMNLCLTVCWTTGKIHVPKVRIATIWWASELCISVLSSRAIFSAIDALIIAGQDTLFVYGSLNEG
jgi:hypothetical protein